MSHLFCSTKNAAQRLLHITKCIRLSGYHRSTDCASIPAAELDARFPGLARKSEEWLFRELQLRTAEFLFIKEYNEQADQ
jgi:hypothetical protein